MDKEPTVFHIEMSPEDGAITDVTLNYNGEWAFVIRVENAMIPEGAAATLPHREIVIAKATITSAPIDGGKGEEATITLFMEGDFTNGSA